MLSVSCVRLVCGLSTFVLTPDTILVLVKCIRVWALTLENLRIQCHKLISAAFPIDLFACLGQAKDLYFKRITFELQLLKRQKGLQNLHLAVGREGTKELYQMLEDICVFPSLRQLHLFIEGDSSVWR